MNKRFIFWSLIIIIGISACSPASFLPESEEDTAGTVQRSGDSSYANTFYQLHYQALFLWKPKNRTYGDGEFNVEYTWERQKDFVRYKVNYTSDGLTIHGFVNIPEGKGPFPVVVALHGYIPANEYETLDYSTRYADSIARKGYIVLHPNMRNFPPSDSVVGRT